MDIVILLDSSGSMHSMGNEPIECLNNFISEQKKLNIPGTKVSYYVFSDKPKCVHKDVLIENFPNITGYNPSGMTSLFDAIKLSVEEKVNNTQKVTMVIISDGVDTCSKTSRSEIMKIIKNQREQQNWQIVYFGTDEETLKESQNIGIGYSASYSPVEGALTNAMRNVSANISAYRAKSYQNMNENYTLTPEPMRDVSNN